MYRWIAGIAVTVLAVLIGLLTATGLPFFSGGTIEGKVLRLHMMAGGGLVVAMPVFCLLFLPSVLSARRSTSVRRGGYWALVLTGLLTIATVFACMLPIASTEQMRQAIRWHAYAGFAMVPSIVIFLAGTARWRRIDSTRSATPG